MWQQRSYFENSNVLDVTIQCQFNMASKNVAEFSTLYSPSSQAATPAGYPQSSPSAFSSCARAPQDPTALPLPPSAENVTPGKHGSAEMDQGQCYSGGMFSNGFTSFPGAAGSKFGMPGLSPPRNTMPMLETDQYSSCMNDSGYGSPVMAYSQQPVYSSASPDLVTMRPRDGHETPRPTTLQLPEYGYPPSAAESSQCSYGSRVGPADPSVVGYNSCVQDQDHQSLSVKSSDQDLNEDMKVAMRERDVAQRLFALRSRDSELAAELESYYQSQTSMVDLERHNVLCQMAYDKTSSDSINKYYNRKLLTVLEFVENKLAKFEKCAKGKSVKRQVTSPKKSRLLPKHAVKILESWYQENLENPYPSREVTLSMASEGNITVEQIRKWFANKRNRSRNSKLKASTPKDCD